MRHRRSRIEPVGSELESAAIVDGRRRDAVEQHHTLGEAAGDFTIAFDSIHRSTARDGRVVEIHEVVLREVGVERESQKSGLTLRAYTPSSVSANSELSVERLTMRTRPGVRL